MPFEIDCSGEGFAIRSSSERWIKGTAKGWGPYQNFPRTHGRRGLWGTGPAEERGGAPTLKHEGMRPSLQSVSNLSDVARTYGVEFTFGSLSTCTTTDKTLTLS